MSETSKLLKISVTNYYKITKREKTNWEKERPTDVNCHTTSNHWLALGFRQGAIEGLCGRPLRFEVDILSC